MDYSNRELDAKVAEALGWEQIHWQEGSFKLQGISPNPQDWHPIHGKPYLAKVPRYTSNASDFELVKREIER